MKLADYLKLTKKTYAAFGAEVEAPPRTVGKWARHERTPRPKKMAVIAKATNNAVTSSDFYEEFGRGLNFRITAPRRANDAGSFLPGTPNLIPASTDEAAL